MTHVWVYRLVDNPSDLVMITSCPNIEDARYRLRNKFGRAWTGEVKKKGDPPSAPQPSEPTNS